nr:hypothetical protein [uncultured Duganella sp.]
MNNEKMVVDWQDKILRECERKLQRHLTSAESYFVRSRQSFLALEMIQDSVDVMPPTELREYLNSDRV